jgi:hypothetical protein
MADWLEADICGMTVIEGHREGLEGETGLLFSAPIG